MKVPSCFYGTYKKVKAEISKLYTQIRRGKPLEDIFGRFEFLDINDYPVEYIPKYNSDLFVPNHLIWLDRMWSLAGGEEHFILSSFSESLYNLDIEKREEIKQKLVPFLSQSEWGCVILNGRQSYSWANSDKCGSESELVPYNGDDKTWTFQINGILMERVPTWKRPIDPDYALCILESTIRYWDGFISYGERFFTGGYESCTFPMAKPLSYFVLARLGCEGEEINSKKGTDYTIYQNGVERYFKWGNIKKVCEKYSLIKKLKEDEDFRNRALEGTLVKRRD